MKTTGMRDLFGDGPGQLDHYLDTTTTSLNDELEGCPEEVANLFERIALEPYRSGRTHFSSDAILHRIRWYYHVEKGDEGFKCNNNWTAALARWFMRRNPECNDFFETRVRLSKVA